MRLDNFFRFFYGKDHPAASYHQTATKMTPIKNISIPKPCHQSWQQMTPVNAGRHCQSCCKTVTDFTKMSNQQIIEHLSLTRNVCGRFNDHQLNGINYKLYADNLPATGGWKKLALVAGFLSSAFSFKAEAQTTATKMEQRSKVVGSVSTVSVHDLARKAASPDSAKFKVISGNIVDENNAPLLGAIVKISSSTTGSQTDINGHFVLTVPATAAQFGVHILGYKPLQVDICADKDYQIKLTTEQASWLGEVAVTRRVSFVRRIYYRCIKRPIRKIFN
jgi:hypothetical protein